MSERIKFNQNWFFHDGEITTPKAPDKGPSYMQAKTEHFLAGPASRNFPDRPNNFFKAEGEDREINLKLFEEVNLPHDYIITQVPEEKNNNSWGFFNYHPAWYRKHFVIGSEDRDKRITLYFEGVADHATVYFNGVYLYDNYEAHTPFEVDLTDFIRFDQDNVLAIHVDCGTNEGWWYQGGGIYRNVWMEKSNPVSVNRYGVYVHPEKQQDLWNVPVETDVRNDTFEAVTATVKTDIVDKTGKVWLSMTDSLKIPDREMATLKQQNTVKKPALWDIDTPNLYEVVTTVSVKGQVTDEKKTTFGFREIYFDADTGFYLNGKNVKVQGVCGHGDYGLTGLAVEESILRYKARLIKEMGANAFRCSHYLHAEAFMDELDKLGIVVMDETRWFSTAPAASGDLNIMLKRDRNHPSVILWSIGNEEPFFITEQGARISRSLYAQAKKLDKTRPVLTANDKDPEVATVYEYSDIVGVNYHMDLFDKLREKYPHMPFLSTENSATGTSRNWYHDQVPSLGRISSYDHDTNDMFKSREHTWQYIYDRPWLMGGMQWIAFEHRGEAAWPRLCSASGAIDLYLNKKDAFYQNQSFWKKEPMIHVLPHWNHAGYEGKSITVFAYTNCEEAELFLNGKSQGRVKIQPVVHAEWQVCYAPGKIEAVGYIGGKEVCRDTEETTGKPVALKLKAENASDVSANEELVLTCTAVDAQGRTVKDASVAKILFFAENGSTVLGTGSDNTDHIPPQRNDRRMFGGQVAVLVRVSAEGKAFVTAEAEGLKTALFEL